MSSLTAEDYADKFWEEAANQAGIHKVALASMFKKAMKQAADEAREETVKAFHEKKRTCLETKDDGLELLRHVEEAVGCPEPVHKALKAAVILAATEERDRVLEKIGKDISEDL